MPYLRNPVGPLPSSIYWRRRLVVLVVLAAVLALLLWLLLGGGGGGGTKPGAAGSSSHPAASITPGTPAPGGPGSSGDGTSAGGGSTGAAPGQSGAGTGTGSAGSSASTPAGTNGGVVVPVTGGATGGNGGTGSGAGSAGTAGGAGGGSAGAAAGGSTGGGSGGGAPANTTGTMNLPACAASDVELSLTSTEQSYSSSQWPTFQLALTNTSGAACRIDLGAKSAVLTVSSDGNTHVWSSGDCPRVVAAQWYAVPASGAPLTASFQWARTTSAPGCTPGGGGAGVGAGTYVARAGVQGVTVQPSHQFKLAPFGS